MAEVPIQALIDHTIKRLFEFLAEKETHKFHKDDIFSIIFKWGCDGSSNHSKYKQLFLDENEEGEIIDYSDSNIFAFSLVPLRLYVESKNSIKKIVWNNDFPSSISLCRPIKLLFRKECSELTKIEVGKMDQQISNLKQTIIQIGDESVYVTSTLVMTMVDTKVVNDINGSRSQACFLCGKTGKMLNDELDTSDNDDPINYKYGLSPLHAYIRAMELFLKIAYRLTMPQPTWRVRKTNNIVQAREKEINSELRKNLGLRISEPIPGGGNTNDGNTARRFFREYKTVSNITGIDINLLERMHTLLVVINCKGNINHVEFQIYAEKTRKLYVTLYGWYPLSPTVHKVFWIFDYIVYQI